MSKPSGEAARDAHGKEISRSNTPFGRCLYPRPGGTFLIEDEERRRERMRTADVLRNEAR